MAYKEKIAKVVSIRRLDQLKTSQFWAEARKRGRPTANPKPLNEDVILAAQATLLIGRRMNLW